MRYLHYILASTNNNKHWLDRKSAANIWSMTYYYAYASLNYSILNIIIRWCIFYCIWNLWTLPRLESTNEHIDISMRVPGNQTILQESLPVHIINGHKTVLISGLLQSFTTAKAEDVNSTMYAAATTDTKSTLKLASHDSSIGTRHKPQDALKTHYNQKPPRRRSAATKHRIPARYQRSNKEIKSQAHGTKSKVTTSQAKASQSPSKSEPVARRLRYESLQSSLGQSAPISQQPQQRSSFVLLVFSCALIGGGMFALRALKRLEKWEILSQEDNLAYDIAHTTKSDSNYGSFDLQSWQDDLSKFDVWQKHTSWGKRWHSIFRISNQTVASPGERSLGTCPTVRLSFIRKVWDLLENHRTVCVIQK